MRYGCTQTEGSGSCSKINRKSDIEVNDNMEIPESIRPPRVVRVIPPTINTQESIREKYKQLRVVAYCRVSTKQEEQLNSYETQKNYYTEKINAEPNWTLAGIFADKGITGTSIKKRDEFKKMIRL